MNLLFMQTGYNVTKTLRVEDISFWQKFWNTFNPQELWLALSAFWHADWFVQFLVLAFGAACAVVISIVGMVLIYNGLTITYVFLDSVWLPAWEQMAASRLHAAGYTNEQMEIINRGGNPGPPALKGMANTMRILKKRDGITDDHDVIDYEDMNKKDMKP